MRIPYDSLTLRAVAGELSRALVGGQVQRISQPSRLDLTLAVRNRGATHQLVMSCDTSFARVHLTASRPPNLSEPTAFCMICRKYLEGAIVRAVAQRDFDRVLDLTCEGPGGADYTLVAELMGKHSNLVLVSESRIVLDAAKRITRKLSRVREVLPGIPYLSPPAQPDRIDPFAATPEELQAFAAESPSDPEARAARLMARFAGISPFLAQEIVLRASAVPLEIAWREVFGVGRDGRWQPVLIRDGGRPAGAYPVPIVQAPADSKHERDSINTALDHYYAYAVPHAATNSLKHEIQTAVEHGVQARRRRLQSLRRSLLESGRADEYRQSGELLLANLHAAEPGAESVTVTDYYAPDAPQRTIPLDPKLSPKANADAYFRRYRKARDGAKAQAQQVEHVEHELAALQAAAHDAASPDVSDTPDAAARLRKLRSDLVSSGLLRRESVQGDAQAARLPDFQGKRIRRLQADGWEILLGENAEANDFLTGKVAAPNDLWLHVRAVTSAHVVVRTANRPESVPRSVLQRAAVLAALHSGAKHASIVPVDYTLRKYVRRPRGAAPGTVLYRNEKTIHVSPKGNE